MKLIKQRKIAVLSIVVLLLSLGLAVYSVMSYKGSSSTASGWSSSGRMQMPAQQGTQRDGAGPPGQRSGNEGNFAREDVNRQNSLSANGQNNSSPQTRTVNPQTPSASSGSDTDSGNTASNSTGGFQHDGSSPPGGGGFREISTTSSYAWPLALYTVLFFGLAAAAYIVLRKTKFEVLRTDRRLLLWSLLGTGLLLRIAAAPWIAGHPFDINLFKSWAASAASDLTGFYLNGSSDYPPFYVYILFVVGQLTSTAALSSYSTLLIKLPSILADVATAYLLYKAACKYLSYDAGLLIALFYVFNPAVFINSTVWGQVDSFFTLLIAAAIYLLSEGKLVWSTIILTLSVLMKPQGIIYLPVLFFALVASRKWKSWLAAAASAVLTLFIVVLPFSTGQNPLWLYNLYSGTVNEYPFASVNAFNFFAFLGANYKPDTDTLLVFSYHTWGLIFIVLSTLFSWWMYNRTRSIRFASASALLLIAMVFTFSSSMHERYLFPAAALALLAYTYLKDKRLLWLAGGFSLTIFVNTYYIFYNSTNGGTSYGLTLFFTSSLNIVLCIYLAKILWDCGSAHQQRLLPSTDQLATVQQIP
ncbi:glycosyltransferase 87 family protein [Paenibacillus sp. SN-8-1]|uniref:glycosyltransferase 87 family protein n=1 Tax=Paenibacillus sp. SN-8-1 TaxID=3435409 RepID=UPI003D9A171B